MIPPRGMGVLIAAVLLSAAVAGGTGGDGWERELHFGKLIEDLRSDSIRWNANRAMVEILTLRGDDVAPIREWLIGALDSADLQQRQLAAVCLTYHFGEVPLENPHDWPPRLTEVLIEAFRADSISGGQVYPNARHALRLFYGMEDGLPVEHLRKVLTSDDWQARHLAAVILADALQDSVQPDVSAVLIQELKDDKIKANAIAAYTGLIQLGRENFKRLIKGLEVEDWQQAAYLQFTAARLKVDWKAPRRFLDEWVAWAERVSDASTGWNGYYEKRISTFALIIHPDGKSYIEGMKVPPYRVYDKRWLLGFFENPADREVKVDRLMSTFQVLKPDEASEGYRRVNARGPM